MRTVLLFLSMLFIGGFSFAANGGEILDLEDMAQDFVLETTKIDIPGYPDAFNPAIIRWENVFLLSFRVIPDPKLSFVSYLGIVKLDENFRPISPPQLLCTRDSSSTVPSRAEDGRLIMIGNDLYIIYSDNPKEVITGGGFRLYVAKLDYVDGQFIVRDKERLEKYDGEDPNTREKNWVPFIYDGDLLLAYRIQPHRIFRPILGTGTCETVCETSGSFDWDWGELRGGTPALVHGDEYLAFFHSVKRMQSVNSNGKSILHYFMGAYTFSLKPPFNITKFSPEPIIGKQFYNGPIYKHYWHPVRVVFPCGFVFDDHYIWIAYGRQDHEVWIAKLDKARLLKSLVSVKSL